MLLHVLARVLVVVKIIFRRFFHPLLVGRHGHRAPHFKVTRGRRGSLLDPAFGLKGFHSHLGELVHLVVELLSWLHCVLNLNKHLVEHPQSLLALQLTVVFTFTFTANLRTRCLRLGTCINEACFVHDVWVLNVVDQVAPLQLGDYNHVDIFRSEAQETHPDCLNFIRPCCLRRFLCIRGVQRPIDLGAKYLYVCVLLLIEQLLRLLKVSLDSVREKVRVDILLSLIFKKEVV